MVHLLLAIIYLSFISLGLPDALLGAAWPTMCQEFSVPVSYAGGISMIIAIGTIISSLQSDRLTKWLGTGKVTAISVGMTAVALFGFSVSGRKTAVLTHVTGHSKGECLLEYTLSAGETIEAVNRCVLEITAVGRPTPMYIPITLLG